MWMFKDLVITLGIVSAGLVLNDFLNKNIINKNHFYLIISLQLIQVISFSFNQWFNHARTETYIRTKGPWKGSDINFFKPPRKGNNLYDWLNTSKEKYGKRIIISKISNDLNAEEPSLGFENYYSLFNLSFFNGLNLINGRFKGISMDRVYPSAGSAKGYIWPDYNTIKNINLLNVCGVNWVLMKDSEYKNKGQYSHLEKVDSITVINKNSLFRVTDIDSTKNIVKKINENFKKNAHIISEKWLLLKNHDAWDESFIMSKNIIKEHDHYKSYIPNFNEFQSVYDKYQNLKSLFFMNLDNKIEHKIDSKVKVMGENGSYKLLIEPQPDTTIIGMSKYYRDEW